MEDGEFVGNFMLHYNFPPFLMGEARPMRGPGRRDIGHGYLAASAIRNVLPARNHSLIRFALSLNILDRWFIYGDYLRSTMALMQGGVPIKAMVSGIAMGLLMSKKGDFKNFV